MFQCIDRVVLAERSLLEVAGEQVLQLRKISSPVWIFFQYKERFYRQSTNFDRLYVRLGGSRGGRGRSESGDQERLTSSPYQWTLHTQANDIAERHNGSIRFVSHAIRQAGALRLTNREVVSGFLT
jgi:hypothetical protein